MLTYILTQESGQPSFDPAHSDTMLNLVFMENIVGTLVKYGASGKLESYHALNRATEHDGKLIRFKLKSDLQCEDGTPINAGTYVQSFYRLLKLLARTNPQLPIMEHLVGFNDFRNGETQAILGLRAEGNSLVFEFDRKPDGLFEFLSMPYYGFYSPSDFDSSGKWRNTCSITSSGTWKLKSFSSKEVLLERRLDLVHEQPSFPKTVKVKMMPFEAAAQLRAERTIINHRIQSASEIPAGFTKFLSAPTDFVGAVLSPFSEGPFQTLVNRQAFAAEMRRQMRTIVFESEVSKKALSFYPNFDVDLEESEPLSFEPNLKKQLHVVISNAIAKGIRNTTISLLNRIATRYEMTLTVENEDRTQPGWKERLDDLTSMDIRIARVDIGGAYEPWVVQMMFCSRLGVSFPDPSGRICKLSSDLSDRSPEVAQKFELILKEDACVIPLFHTSFGWLVSGDLSLGSLSPSTNILRFEFVELK